MKRNRDEENIRDIKKKIQSFKLIQLQSILNLFNLPKLGRKTELQDRIVSFAQNGVSDSQWKLLNDKIEALSMSSNSNKASYLMPNPIASTKRLKTEESFSSCSINSIPQVKFRKIPFFDELAVILPPKQLTITGNSYDQINSFEFILSAKQVSEIEKNRVTKLGKVEYPVQVQLRLCQFDTKSEQKDLFPQNLQIRVNSRIITLPNFLPARPNTTPVRPSKPLNITQFVRFCPTTANTLEVRWKKDALKSFALTCKLVRQLSSEDLFKRLTVRNEEDTRNMIKEQLNKEVDSEIATTVLHVSLNCPLGKLRMNVPCRATTCKHLQCFDTMLYLKMNELKQSWICPVCDKEALFENLAIDGYFALVLKSLDPSVTEIQLNKDGSWSRLKNNVKEVKKLEEYLVISDDEDINNNSSESVGQSKNPIIVEPKPEKTTVEPKKHKKNRVPSPILANKPSCTVTIDLTLDD